MNPLFTALKSVHVITVIVTLTGFMLRGWWMLTDSQLLEARWTRILPHVNDTVLLLSALGAAAALGQYPFVHAWLTAKVAGLLCYIGFGAVALTYGRSRRSRSIAFVAALASFAYVVAVAITKNPLPFG